MRPLTIGFAVLLVPGLAFFACSQDPASQTIGSSGTGGAPNCDAVTVVYGFDAGNSCDICLHKECCAQVASCADKACLDCVNYGTGDCKTNTEALAVDQCIVDFCLKICRPGTAFSGTGGGTSSSSSD